MDKFEKALRFDVHQSVVIIANCTSKQELKSKKQQRYMVPFKGKFASAEVLAMLKCSNRL